MKLFLALLMVALMATTASALDVGIEATGKIVTEKELTSNIGDMTAEYKVGQLSLPIEVNDVLTIAPLVGVISNATIEGDGIDVALDDALMVGLKADLALLQGDVCDVNLIGVYKTSDLEVEPINVFGPINANGDVSLKEYSVEARVSKALEAGSYVITPYVGVRLSDIDADAEMDLFVLSMDADIEQEENIGITAGVTLVALDNLEISLDGSIRDEESIGISGTLKF